MMTPAARQFSNHQHDEETNTAPHRCQGRLDRCVTTAVCVSLMANTEVLPAPPKKVITHPRQQKIDVAKALKLRLQGNTFEEIGAVFGCNKQAVYQALDKFKAFLGDVEAGNLTAYSENRAELFNAVEKHLSGSLLDPQALEKASLNNRAYALKVIHEARRLETGQSTSNLSVLGKLVMAAEANLGATKAQVVDKASGSAPHEGVVPDGDTKR